MPTDPLAHWYSEQQAADKLGTSTRNLRRMANLPDGPERRRRPVEGRVPEPCYKPEDIERMAAPKGKVIAPGSQLLPKPGDPTPATLETLTAAVAQIAAAVAQHSETLQVVTQSLLEPPAALPTVCMTIAQGSAYTGISELILMAMVRARRLPAFRDRALGNGPLKVLRADLDKLADIAELSKWGQELKLTTDELRQVVTERKAGGQ